ncbi:MAG TPA: N-acetyltransferase [bacterium]|nr:N-acetyltransferase [bacterium]HPN44054.1 N-acetyltransferase [bacterium]
MNNPVNIRRAEKADAEILVNFNLAMALETENKILRRDEAWSGVLNLLQTPQNGFYLVAENDWEITGALLITFEWSDWRNGMFWWLQSVYVKPEYRQKGIFKSLYTHVKKLAGEQKDVCGLRLYVHANNISAQQTYRKLGMQKTAYSIFETEFEIRN